MIGFLPYFVFVMSINEFLNRLGATIIDIENSRDANAVKIALDSLALVKRRVINTGVNEKGSKFGNYSKAVVPFFYYYGKETNRNNATVVKELYERKGFWASYRDWREVNNLPVEFINFSFTNRMWSSLAPAIETRERFRTVVGIAARTGKEQDKLNWQNRRFGDILAVNQQERDLISRANDARIRGSFQKNGLL